MPATTTPAAESESLTAAELASILDKRAESDLRYVRKYGQLLIAGLKGGTSIDLCWTRERSYFVSGDPEHTTATKRLVKGFLTRNYFVSFE